MTKITKKELPALHEPEVQFNLAENEEVFRDLIAKYGAKLPGFTAMAPKKAATKEFNIIGKPTSRIEGFGIVTGTGKYASDVRLPGMLSMKTLYSPFGHARIKQIDTSKAEALPGVHAVLTYANLPEEYRDVKLSGGPPPRYILPQEVFYVGEEVAIVAAEDESIAEEALGLIEVQYEELPAVYDPLEAMQPGAPKNWDNDLDGNIVAIADPIVRGDLDKGFAEADLVLEDRYATAVEQHSELETSGSVTIWEGDHLTIWDATQYAYGVRDGVSRALGVPQGKVRVISPGYVGGGFGNKTGADRYQVHAALLAKVTGRPVQVRLSRTEQYNRTTHRYPVISDLKMGVKKDGTITAYSVRCIADNGAVGGSNRATGPLFTFQQLYTVANARFEATSVFTNKFRSGALRCVGHPQAAWAQEIHVDRIAHELGMNPLDFRLKNINEVGDQDSGLPYSKDPGLRECIVKGAERIGWKEQWHPPGQKLIEGTRFHGLGMAAFVCTHGSASPPMSGIVIVNTDGSLEVVSAAQDTGSGVRTAVTMIAAEEVGIPWEQTSITPETDTSVTPNTGGTFGSRMTPSGGWGILEAARDAKRQILELAAEMLEAEPDKLDTSNGEVFVVNQPDKKVTIAEVASKAGGPIIGRGFALRPTQWQMAAFAAHFVEVEVDKAIGDVKVTRLVAAHDVGRAINPVGIEQQIEGGVVQGIGAALFEQNLVDPATGVPINSNFLDYRMPSVLDVPLIESIIVEHPREYHPLGIHGVGEPPIAVPAPAIANAIFNAVGVRVTTRPLTRDKILAALKAV